MNHDQQIAAALTDALGAIEDQVWVLYERGKDEAALQMASGLVARCKQAAADPVEAAGARFIAALRAQLGDDAVKTWLQQQTQALQGAGSGGARATLSSSGDQSAQKAYDPSRDLYAIGMGADQAQPHRLKATDDSNVEAALREVSTAAGSYRNEIEPNRRVATQWLKALAQRLRDNIQMYGKDRR